MELHQYYDEGSLAEAREDWQTVLDGLHAIARHAAVLEAPHGVTDPQRAAHAGIRPDGMAHGAPAVTPAPDPFTGQHATIRRGRNKRGATLRVIHTGRAFVSGPNVWGERDATGRVRSDRMDALTLARMADEILSRNVPEGETLESVGLSLIGSVQGRSWEQMVRAEGSRDAVTLAQHRTDIGGGFIDARRIVVTSAARADHKYRPTHSPGLGNTLADAAACEHGRPVRKVRTFPISRMVRSGAPIIPRAAAPRRDDPDTVEVERVGRDGKVRMVRKHTGRTPDGRLVTYGDRLAVRRTVDGRNVLVSDTGAYVYDDRTPVARRTRVVVRTISTERVAVGHVWQDRPNGSRAARDASAAIRAERRDAVRRDAVARVTADGPGAALVTAWNGTADGTRVTVPIGSGRLTFTRHDGRPVEYRYDVDGSAPRKWTSRTPAAAAVRLATVLTA